MGRFFAIFRYYVDALTVGGLRLDIAIDQFAALLPSSAEERRNKAFSGKTAAAQFPAGSVERPSNGSELSIPLAVTSF